MISVLQLLAGIAQEVWVGVRASAKAASGALHQITKTYQVSRMQNGIHWDKFCDIYVEALVHARRK